MKFRKLLLSLGLVSLPAIAEEYSNVSTIADISITDYVVSVRLENMKVTNQCSGQRHEWYALDPNGPFFPEKYSALLSANAMKESIFFQINGCASDFGKITVVYLCENTQCN